MGRETKRVSNKQREIVRQIERKWEGEKEREIRCFKLIIQANDWMGSELMDIIGKESKIRYDLIFNAIELEKHYQGIKW